jgi:hypothetical protein
MRVVNSGRAQSRLAAALAATVVIGLTLVCPDPASAYIGPGAGFALVSSFFVFFVTLLSALASLLLFPLRLLLRTLRPRRSRLARRVVVIGFDGQDPRITEQLMAQGRLPAFSALAAQGSYRQLQTTTPPISPVAWSSFATGVQPGKHGIFDFVVRDPRTYGAELAGVALAPPRRTLKLGPLRIPLGRPVLRLTRGSRPFWSILGEHRIWSTVLRVPVSFPPDRFHGAQLAAAGAPDLKGTQGTFTLFTSRPVANRPMENGDRIVLDRDGRTWRAQLDGPPSSLIDGRRLSLAVRARPDGPNQLHIAIGTDDVVLRLGELSPWTRLIFRDVWPIKVAALVRFQLLEAGEHLSIYMSPMHLDPAHPAMPLSHPGYFSAYLEKRIGPFATLGLAEDTSSFNEGIVDEATFLQQVNDIDRERSEMLIASLDRMTDGVVVCVFDATDRVQHMCWAGGTHAAASSPIVQRYERNDRMRQRLAGGGPLRAADRSGSSHRLDQPRQCPADCARRAVERMDTGRLPADPKPDAARHDPVLSPVGAPGRPAVCLADRHRSGRTGDADLDAAGVRHRPVTHNRPLLYARDHRGNEGALGWCLLPRRFSVAGVGRTRGSAAPVSFATWRVHRRAVLLSFRLHRSGVAHVSPRAPAIRRWTSSSRTRSKNGCGRSKPGTTTT